jgi:hypothetical protein
MRRARFARAEKETLVAALARKQTAKKLHKIASVLSVVIQS